MRKSTYMIAGLLLLGMTGGVALAQSQNSEKGPISHPTADANTKGSEKGPVSHPTADAGEKGPVSHPTAADKK